MGFRSSWCKRTDVRIASADGGLLPIKSKEPGLEDPRLYAFSLPASLIGVGFTTVASEFRKRGSNHEGPLHVCYAVRTIHDNTPRSERNTNRVSTAASLLLAHHFFLQLAARLLGIAHKLLGTLHAALAAFLHRSFHQFLLMLLTGVIKLCPVRLFQARPWAFMVPRYTSTPRFEMFVEASGFTRQCSAIGVLQ